MIVKNKKYAFWGSGLALSFILVFFYLFTPTFDNGLNAFEAADKMFNSISKGSVYYIPDLLQKAEDQGQNTVVFQLKKMKEQTADRVAVVLTVHGKSLSYDPDQKHLEGMSSMIVRQGLDDAEILFKNDGERLERRYGISGRKVILAWWEVFRQLELHLKDQKQFDEAAFIHEARIKGLEIAYNYYGIEPEKVKDELWRMIFALLFYVVYTMWWGYAIFFLFEAVGLTMTAGTKKEV